MPWAAKNREAMVAFARNYKRGVRWLYDPANRQQAIDILVKYARQDPKDIAEAYDYLHRQAEAVRARRRRVGQGL